ncbi:MAG: helix-turn-helix domain-containing protein [Chitinophagaceae bacterium]
MKNKPKDIPHYSLKNFRHIHRLDNTASSFGYNNIDISKKVDGFEMYSSEGLIQDIGPLKSEFFRISITVTGTLDMQIGLDHYTHQPRTLSFTFPNQIFSKNNISEDASGYYILFNPDFLNDIVLPARIPDEFPFFNISGTPVFQISEAELKHILVLLTNINDELRQQKSGQEKAIKMYLYLLLLEAKRSYERQNLINNDIYLSENYKLTNRFKKLVAQHYLTKRQVGDYAQMLGVSANHLNKTIKENTGQTASEAIREMLLQEAKSLLFYTDNSIAEIAYRLDFSDPASFNRFFKTMTSETPLIFRKRNN